MTLKKKNLKYANMDGTVAFFFFFFTNNEDLDYIKCI